MSTLTKMLGVVAVWALASSAVASADCFSFSNGLEFTGPTPQDAVYGCQTTPGTNALECQETVNCNGVYPPGYPVPVFAPGYGPGYPVPVYGPGYPYPVYGPGYPRPGFGPRPYPVGPGFGPRPGFGPGPGFGPRPVPGPGFGPRPGPGFGPRPRDEASES